MPLLAVDPDALVSIARSPRAGSSLPLSGFERLARVGEEGLAGLRSAAVLASFCRAWIPVHRALLARGAVLTAELESAGGEYARLDRGLSASVGASSPR